MQNDKLILLTGAAGFIASYLLGFLNKQGYQNIIIADDFSRDDKISNYNSKKYKIKIERDQLFDWLEKNHSQPDQESISFVFHIGARTDTTEFDYAVHEKLNVEYSKKIWEFCKVQSVPLVYASSAATYGNGELGYKDDHDLVEKLDPLNPYGKSKNEFDKWALKQISSPPFWAGLKFFNVYGPNEYHKGRMASVIFHSFNQITANGKVKLFRSHKLEFKDGEQIRDFIYVEDIAKVCFWLMNNHPTSGLYNLGTGVARTFKDLVNAIFSSLQLPSEIEYIDMPADIRERYQYYTQAEMNKLISAGYRDSFLSLEQGVHEYVTDYLAETKYY